MTDFERRLRAAMAAAAGPAPAGIAGRHPPTAPAPCPAGRHGLRRGGGRRDRGNSSHARDTRGRPGGPGPRWQRPGRYRPGGCDRPARRPARRTPCSGTASPQRRDAGLQLESPERARWPGLVHLRPPGHALAQPPADRREDTCLRHGHRGPQRPHGRGHGGSLTRRAVPVPGCLQHQLDPYTLSEGAPGLTLAGCPAAQVGHHIPARYAPGLTMFWEGFVTDLRGCIPLDVRASSGSQPVRVTIAATDGGCGS